jgi:energy-converting hydrogenase Eha subunit A
MSGLMIAPRHLRGQRVLRPPWVGVFFLWTSGIHVGIVAAGPDLYAHFADHALVPGLARVWSEVFMAYPTFFGLAVAALEACLGLLLVASPRPRRFGWAGAIAFQCALMAFGWGFWIWSLPALAFLVPAAIMDARTAGWNRTSSVPRLEASRLPGR